MLNKKFLFPFVLAQFIFPSLIAQNQQNTFDKNVQQIDTDIKQIAEVFKKKNKDKTQLPQTSESNNNNQNDSLKPGDISPNAKTIDADELYAFNGGAGVIRKGDATALINSKGEFIIPYNTYKIKYPLDNNQFFDLKSTGLFITEEGAVLNAQGKLLKPKSGDYLNLTIQGDYGHYSKDRIEYYIDIEGKTYKSSTLQNNNNDFHEGIGIDKNGNYVSIKRGQLITKPYSSKGEFHNGMSWVGMTDEFGTEKYGYIDSTGKEIIPLSFSIKPRNFNSGLAKVFPRNESEFKYAFINKAGKVKFSQTSDDAKKYGEFEDFNYGYSFSGRNNYIIDTDGKILTNKEFFSLFGLNDNDYYDNIQRIALPSISRGPYMIYSSRTKKIDGVDKSNLLLFSSFTLNGVINLYSKKSIPPVFYYNASKPDCFLFDPISGLAYAEKFMGKDKTGKVIWRKGYINEAGIFMIVIGEPSKW